MAPTKKTKAAPKKRAPKKNGYDKPAPVPPGEVVTDLKNVRWKIGPSIGVGGFGEIYLASKLGDTPKKNDDYQYVTKFEPHKNGPLFVEMHFYMRSGKKEKIDEFCKEQGLKKLGVPHFVGHGSHDLNGEKHRFLIIPRYGKDIAHYLEKNGNRFAEHTIYRLAIQMIHAYEYIHESTYVHADLKGSNMLLEFSGKSKDQVYLLDYGLAAHYTVGDYKPDPRKKHNGTIEYTSIDAHNGVTTMRGDMEILGYNLVQWFGVELPWIKDKLLDNPQKVQSRKEAFMKDVKQSLQELFKPVPAPLEKYMLTVKEMKHNEPPDYDACRKIFEDALKKMKKPLQGDLELELGQAGASKSPKVSPVKKAQKEEVTTAQTKSPVKRTANANPVESTPSKKLKTSPIAQEKRKNKDPVVTINENVKISTVKPNTGSTTVKNVKTTKNSKTYTVDVELDVSLDANVVVNVIRKQKNLRSSPRTPSSPLSAGNSPRKGRRNVK